LFVPLALALTSLSEAETCPAPAEVRERVLAILRLSAEPEPSESFLVERHEAGLFVELRGADATLIGQRILPNEGSCAELAQAAAVVLGAWLSDVHPDFAGDLPSPLPEAEPAAEPVREPPPAPVEPPRRAPPKPKPPPTTARRSAGVRRQWEISAGLGAGHAGSKLAWAGIVRTALLPEQGMGAALTLLVDTERREQLGEGFVSWRRWPLGLGPTLRLRGAALVADLSLAPALVWVRASGANFQPNLSQTGFTWAGMLDVRLASRSKVAAFAALNAQTYLARSRAFVGAHEYPLPPLVFSILLGARLAP